MSANKIPCLFYIKDLSRFASAQARLYIHLSHSRMISKSQELAHDHLPFLGGGGKSDGGNVKLIKNICFLEY